LTVTETRAPGRGSGVVTALVEVDGVADLDADLDAADDEDGDGDGDGEDGDGEDDAGDAPGGTARPAQTAAWATSTVPADPR
jgi:hypothetical protein